VKDDEPIRRNPVVDATRATGRAIGSAAAWIGRKARVAYLGIDPDLRAHLAQLPLVWLTLIPRGSAEVRPLPDDGHRPVVFVHGLGGAPGNFLPMQVAFRVRGRRRTYTWPLPRGIPIADLGPVLAAFLEEVAVRNGLARGERLDVVAHSLGGLVARLALEHPAARQRVATLITLGTPHAGSHLARYGAMDVSLALRPGSDVMERLASQIPWRGPPEMPRLVCVWSPADVIVLPATSARVEGAENIEVPGFTHYSYLIHPRSWSLVFEALGGPTSR